MVVVLSWIRTSASVVKVVVVGRKKRVSWVGFLMVDEVISDEDGHISGPSWIGEMGRSNEGDLSGKRIVFSKLNFAVMKHLAPLIFSIWAQKAAQRHQTSNLKKFRTAQKPKAMIDQ